jgi:hypothetical protein
LPKNLNSLLIKVRILDLVLNILQIGRRKKEEENMSKSSNVNIAVSFVKQNGSSINSEVDFYTRTEEFLGRNVTLKESAQIQKLTYLAF